MATIKYKDKSIEVKDGSAIKETCKDLGVPFGCEDGICGTCMIQIESGSENLNEQNQKEKDLYLDKNIRLACQAKIKSGTIKIKLFE